MPDQVVELIYRGRSVGVVRGSSPRSPGGGEYYVQPPDDAYWRENYDDRVPKVVQRQVADGDTIHLKGKEFSLLVHIRSGGNVYVEGVRSTDYPVTDVGRFFALKYA